MPAKPKYTREALLDAALDIIRESSIESITAQELGRRLNASAPSVFTHFQSVEDIRRAAMDTARAKFDRYVEEGMAMNPPFKGFGLECLHFAADEPKLYALLFMRPGAENPLMHYVQAEGLLGRMIELLQTSFGLSEDNAHWLFSSLVVYTHGLCCMIACDLVHYTQAQQAELLGSMFRRLVIGAKAPADDRTGIIPQKDAALPEDPAGYV